LVFDYGSVYLSFLGFAFELFFLFRLFYCCERLLSYKANFYEFYKVRDYQIRYRYIFPKRNLATFFLFSIFSLGSYLFYFIIRFSLEINVFITRDRECLKNLSFDNDHSDESVSP
jgi:hypothetical protein